MSLVLNQNILQTTFASGVLVMLGVIFKNGSTQLNHPQEYTIMGAKWSQYELIGLILFTLGWGGFIFATNRNRFTTVNTAMIASLGIWAAVVGMMYFKKLPSLPQFFKILPIIFAVSWLVLGYAVSVGKRNLAKCLGIGSAVMVLLAMMYFLPLQRKNCVVDGPGMALFAIAWAAFAMANAI